MKKLMLLLISLMLITSLIGCDEPQSNNKTNDDEKGFININGKDNVNTPVEKEIKCDIKFEENGGSKVEDLSVVRGSELNKAPKTSRENYIFDGWYLDQSLIEPVVFPLEIKSDKILYAKWIKTKYIQKFANCDIEWDSDYNSAAIYSITPSGYEYDELTKKGYTHINIKISYKVHYIKDYNVPLDIGYAGSPKYEVSIYNQNITGYFYKDLPTTKQGEVHTYEFSVSIADLKTEKWHLKFSTNNIQNVIHFDDITVMYAAAK